MTIIQGFLEGLRPTPNLTIDEWADRYRMLSSVSSAEPGPWKTSRVPYMREIFKKLSPSDPCREVVLMKGVQIAGTEVALNVVGAYIDMEACPILYVMPTVDMAKTISKKRLNPMIQDCPSLKDKVSDMNRREGSSTQIEKFFPGGALNLTGANSAAGLRSQPMRVLLLDEVDAYPLNLEGEGSPIKLAEARTTTYAKNKKIFKLSTPTVAGRSAIAFALDGTDEREYHVPCPHCGEFQTLKFDNLKWDKDKPETAQYLCDYCACLIDEKHKTQMLDVGVWKPKYPEFVSEFKAGYRINSLYSPLGWLSWAEIATKFLAEKDDSILFRTFVNTVLGEPWEDRGDAPEWERLFERRSDYDRNSPTNEVELITVGCDVQKDRIELEVVGWLRNKTTYSLDYRILEGDPTKTDVWDRLGEVIKETWMRPDGVELPMMLMAVDANYNTQHVYNFCRKYSPNQVIPVRGRDQQKTIVSSPSSVDFSLNGKAMGKTKVWNVGVGFLKSVIYGDLRLTQNEDSSFPPGYCHFPNYQVEYFKGITAEQLQMKVHKGYPKYEWVKTYVRNEPLDLRVYNRAAAHVVGIDRFTDKHWDNLVGKYRVVKEGHAEPIAPKKAKAPKSDFWAGR
jgi:phage terminase large subunit GpA-like protein